MIGILNAVPLKVLFWLVPVFLTLHNMEEAPFMEKWSKRLPVKIHPVVSTRQFVVAVTVLTIAAFCLTYIGLEWLPVPLGYQLILGVQAILFVNAFIPHLATTIRFRLYSPGVLTALLLNVPLSVYLFQRAMAEGILNWSQLWLLFGIAPFAMALLAFISLQIGKLLSP